VTPLGTLKNRLWEGFGLQNGCPREGAKTFGFEVYFGFGCPLGAKMAPRSFQRPPKIDFSWFGRPTWCTLESKLKDFSWFCNPSWWILELNLMDFGVHLGGFWIPSCMTWEPFTKHQLIIQNYLTKQQLIIYQALTNY